MSEVRADRYIALLKEGHTPTQIAAICGVSRQAVSAALVRRGIHSRRPVEPQTCFVCGGDWTDWFIHWVSSGHQDALADFTLGVREVVHRDRTRDQIEQASEDASS